MSSTIRVLDEKTINQIAAGEVIEGPASVVKELVDNALDARSRKIAIWCTNSGRQSIRVQDDGIGMSHDDALLCLERHATSKIGAFEDLLSLSSLGFRGEAISSIASVSEFRLLTAKNSVTQESLVEGTLVQASGGKILSHTRVKALGGTDIEVRSLFFNVPARKKFLKSPAKDANDIYKTVLKLALAHPEVAFEVTVNQERMVSVGPSTREVRLRELLGDEFFSTLQPVVHKTETISIEGFISRPECSHPNRQNQYLFVNQRPISSLFISHLVKEGYGASLDPVRHPAFVLFVDLKADCVDVNVHPQKLEVRFSLEEEIKRAILTAVGKALFFKQEVAHSSGQPLVGVEAAPPFAFSPSPYTSSRVFEASHSVRLSALAVQEPALFSDKTSGRVLGIVGSYIVAQICWSEEQKKALPEEVTAEGLSLISSHAALSRIAYDGLERAQLERTQDEMKGTTQMLLVPRFLELSVPEANRLRQIAPQLIKEGIVLRDFGASSFLIEGVPQCFAEIDIEEMVKHVLSLDAISSFAEAVAKYLCQKKSKIDLTKEVAEKIVEKLLACSNPVRCPFGSRILALLTAQEMDKKFR